MKTLREEFYNKFKYDKPDYDEIADWWLSKIEEVIEDIPDNYEFVSGRLAKSKNNEMKFIKQQLRSKWLGK